MSAPIPRRLPCAADADRLPGFLSVLQLMDSAFPSGRYTLSYGVETLAQSGRLSTPAAAETLVGLLRDFLQLSVGPSDGVALACAHRAVGPDGDLDLDLIVRADKRLTAVKLSREARVTSERTGRALLRTAASALNQAALPDYARRVQDGSTPGNHAVVIGV
ncbi:MAG: urease accessory protein UreF, partial [Mycobacteriales bacterium]